MQGPETRPTLIGKLSDPACEQAWNEFSRLYRDIIYRVARARGLQDAALARAKQMLAVANEALEVGGRTTRGLGES